VLGFVRDSSGELNVSLISRHVAVCMAGRLMITNDTIYMAGHVNSISLQYFSLMLSSFIDRRLVTTNVDLDGCKNYGSATGWTRWAQYT